MAGPGNAGRSGSRGCNSGVSAPVPEIWPAASGDDGKIRAVKRSPYMSGITSENSMAATETPRRRLERALAALDLSWSVFSDFIIGSPPDEVTVDYVVIHPERGVALLDLGPHGSAEAVARFRELLASERFGDRFPGTLPVIRLVVDPDEVQRL